MGQGTEKIFLQRRHVNGQQVRENVLNITNHQGNANQNYKEISSHTCQHGYYQKKKTITSVSEDMEKREPLYIVSRNVNWCSRYGKQYGGSSKN